MDSQRRLAAIVFTDIQGYTAMMQEDEQLGLNAVKRHQRVMEDCVGKYGGEIYQFYGDGSLSIFNSATDAVQCAFYFQKQFLEEPILPLRTGIHIGEIYREDGKIYGDGVNLASRIESIGQPGTVLFSREVFEKIRNHKEFQTELVGKFHFKNIDQPREIYALVNPEIRRPVKKKIRGKLKERKSSLKPLHFLLIAALLIAGGFILNRFILTGDKSTSLAPGQERKSIAVLPFENLSGEGEEVYLSAGIAEDILTQLSKINGLKVIARSSSARYENSGLPLSTIARELGVISVLQGTVRKYSDMLRISVKLVDPTNGTLLWAEDYDREFSDVLIVQRDVAVAVSDALRVTLSPAEKNRFDNIKTIDPDAYMQYQKGQRALQGSSGTTSQLSEALDYFNKALEIDPEFSLAYTGLADTYLEYLFWHRAKDSEMLPLAKQAAQKALELDPQMGEAYGVLASVHLNERNTKAAIAYYDSASALSPNSALIHERYAWAALWVGDEKKAYKLFSKALEIDPLSTRFRGSLGTSYYQTGNFEKGIEMMEKFRKEYPNDNFILWVLAYNYAGKGDYNEAVKVLEERTIGKNTNWLLSYCYAKLGDPERAGDILQYNLEKAKTEYVPAFMIGVQYLGLGYEKEALDYLERGLENGNENFFYYNIAKDPLLKSVKDNPRFQALVRDVREKF